VTNNTERKALLGQGEAAVLLSALQDADVAIVVYRYDMATGCLRIAHVNEAFTRQTGYDGKQILGQPPGEFPGLPSDQPARDRIRAALKKQPPVLLELISSRKDGSDFWNQQLLRPIHDKLGQTTHWLQVERDVSVPLTSEQRLQTENFRLTRLISIARSLSATLDGRELVARFKAGVRQLTGAEAILYAPRGDGRFARTEDLESPSQSESFGDELIQQAGAGEPNVIDFARTRAAVAVTPTGGRPIFVIEAQARKRQVLRESDFFAVQLLAQYLAGPARNVELYAELNALRSSAIELIELKSDLIAMLAHDFQGPLTAIIGFAEVLGNEPSQSEDDRECLRTIARAGNLLSHLAADTLSLSSLERNDFTLIRAPVDVVALVREVAGSLEGRRTVSVHSDLASAEIQADESRLRQVFYNVVDNAIKYSPESCEVRIFIKQKKNHLHIEVTDSGIGIPFGENKSLFKRFARASNVRNTGIAGSGFGLYLTKMILESHGGGVSILRKPDTGTTFRISLPLGKDRVKAPSCNVLTCEAQTGKRSFLVHTLRLAGLKVSEAGSYEQLFERLLIGNYDYLIVDAGTLALTDGQIKCLEELSAEKHFHVIILSADGHTPSKHFSALLKPFLVKDLLAAVRARSSKKIVKF